MLNFTGMLYLIVQHFILRTKIRKLCLLLGVQSQSSLRTRLHSLQLALRHLRVSDCFQLQERAEQVSHGDNW